MFVYFHTTNRSQTKPSPWKSLPGNDDSEKYKNSVQKVKSHCEATAPRPAGSFQIKSKSQSVMETSSSSRCSTLSNEQTVTADFILDPPPTWFRGDFFFFFWRLQASYAKSQENPYRNTCSDSFRDSCTHLNRVIGVSSSHLPPECIP